MKQILLLIIIGTSFNLLAQNQLRVMDADWPPYYAQNASIDEATITIEPQGLYMEVGLYLTLSATGTSLSSHYQDNLELILDFNLPSGSIIHDSWLWMLDDSTIVKGEVLEIWQATNIYEEVVDRQVDPSLLFEKPNSGYQLRVYPLIGDEHRKVKITYLVPTVWADGSVSAILPMGILNSSNTPLDFVSLITLDDPNSVWQNPHIVGANSIPFLSVPDPVMGDLLVATIPPEELSKPLRFEVSSPLDLNSNVYVNKYEDADANFYQLAYQPPISTDPPPSRNIAFLFDHQNQNSSTPEDQILAHLEQTLVNNLDAQDQFNLFFPQENESGIDVLSNNWLSADPSTIDLTFDMPACHIRNQSNIIELLETAIDFIINSGEAGEIVLFANSSSIYNGTTYIEDLLNQIGNHSIRVHIINYQTDNTDWISQGNSIVEYYHHQAFYKALTQQTGGYLYSTLDGDGDLWENTTNCISVLKQSAFDFDLVPISANGFTFDRFYQDYQGQSGSENKIILQTGKYYGDFPEEFDFYAITENNTFIFENKTIAPSSVFQSDSLSREIWYGHYLSHLETQASNNNEIQAIANLSIIERVLTPFTAFLVLDVNLGGEPCIGCWSYEELLINISEAEADDLNISLSTSPNPFIDQCLITISLEEETEKLNLQLFDANGKSVYFINTESLKNTGQLQWTWNGTNQHGDKLAAGIYYLVLQTDSGIQHQKIVLGK